MDQFEFFFAFYGLILGLAVAELLNGVAGLVRARRVRRVGLQTALLAAFVMLALVATWLDAWSSLKDVRLALSDIAMPLGIGGLYYLAAVIVFPKDVERWESLDDYFAERKAYVAVLLSVAELLVSATFAEVLVEAFRTDPARFWGWLVPYNVAIHGALLALIFVKGRRWSIALLSALLLLFLIPYWDGAG